MATDNIAANIIVNQAEKQKISRAIYMIFYWIRDIIQQNHFHILWEEGNKNLSGCVTKHHPIWHHRIMRPRYVKSTKKYIEISKNRKNGARSGCAGTTNPRRTQKPDNTLKGILNPIPRNPDNPLKGIRYLVQIRTQSQWLKGLTVLTYS